MTEPPRAPLVHIGSARIGPGQPAYVIAEAGVNHNGDVATARTMILRVADAGLATGLPLIVSTGAATIAEIDGMVARAERAGAQDRLVLLHCVRAYPTDEEWANVRVVQTLRDRYACVTGFSDHTRSNACAGLAVAAGAALLEKHFTLDRAQPGPDHTFSLEPTQLTEYVAAVRQAERICGNGEIGVLDCEQEVRQLARASVVAARRLRAGETLGPATLAVKRPGGGIAPDEMHRLIGRTVKHDVPEDTPLTWATVD